MTNSRPHQGTGVIPAVPPLLAVPAHGPLIAPTDCCRWAPPVTQGLRPELLRPTRAIHSGGSGGNFGRFPPRVGLSQAHPSLAASADLLSSVIAVPYVCLSLPQNVVSVKVSILHSADTLQLLQTMGGNNFPHGARQTTHDQAMCARPRMSVAHPLKQSTIRDPRGGEEHIL